MNMRTTPTDEQEHQIIENKTRKTRSDKGQRRLTERDPIVLARIGEQSLIRFDVLQRELADRSDDPAVRERGILSLSRTEKTIQKWKSLGLIEHAKPFTYLPSFIWLTAKGLAVAGLDLPATHPAESTFQHLHWCFVVRRYIERERPQYTWWSERYLRQNHAEAAKARGEGRSHKLPDLPDAHLETPKGLYAVEVELSAKQQWKLDAIIQKRAYAYGTVWYFCSEETKARVDAAIGKLREPYQNRVSTYPLPALK